MLKRLIEALAVTFGATSLVLDSEIKKSHERAVQNPSNPENPNRRAGHELTDMSAKLLLSLAIAMIVFALIMHICIASGLFYLKRRLTQTQPKTIDAHLVAGRTPPPAPRLQHNPPYDYSQYRIQQDQFLGSYGWVDKKSGVARIPIQRAMEILSHEK
jgi:hypothetical protein